MELWTRGFCRAPSHNIREHDGDTNELGAHGLPLISYTAYRELLFSKEP